MLLVFIEGEGYSSSSFKIGVLLELRFMGQMHQKLIESQCGNYTTWLF